ncbi:non-ribosomal peptide synthetase [Actinacidiphila bryophytorum]|nr:non-ribosomal peptide synthetase [Actinacidiphila bryophytorum]MBM9438475.1 non-ribosomal peptide synthetase [Actinacidiphila bryophytorum]
MNDRPPAGEARNVGQLLLRAAARYPESGLYYRGTGSSAEFRRSSYPELLDQALRLLSGLRGLGLRPRDRVLLLMDDAEAFLPGFWACVLGGFVPCPLPPAAGNVEQAAAHHRHVHRLLGGPLLVTGERLAAEVPQVPGLTVATVEALADHDRASDVYEAEPEDLAVLMLTSGSTGQAKAVMLTHANLLASMRAKNGFHELGASDTVLNWVGFDHVAALLECHLLPLSTGSSQLHVPSSHILDEPLEFLRLISRHHVTVTFTPNFLLGLVNSARHRMPAGEALDLSRLRHIVSGGEAVPYTTGTAFLERFAPFGLRRDVLWPAFGMTETCAGSIYSLGFPDADAGQEFASVGLPVAALDVRVADAQDRALPDGRAGEVQLRGPMITPGYYHNEEATSSSRTADGWFRTGDIGRLRDGRLTLVGRSKDNIIVNGVNYFSHEIETALEELDHVTPSFVAAFPTRPEGSDTEQLVVAFHPRTRPGDDTALYDAMTAVRAAVVMHWGFRPALVLPLAREEFVKNSLGKISRAKLRARLEAGEFDDVTRATVEVIRQHMGDYSPPRTDNERALVRIYGETLDVSPSSVSATANFFDLGGTSLDLLRLRGSITQRLNVPGLQTIDLLNAPTVRALAGYLDENPAGTVKTDDGYDPIVPMQQGGTKTPLFCVHPGAGEVLVLLDLARHFAGDRPFHALRARGFTSGETPFTSHGEMIAAYTRAIQDRQPHGPYALAGYSSGGLIAFAIAQELQSRGEQVAFLGGFDFPPVLTPLLVGLDFSVTVSVLSHFLGLLDKEQSEELPGKLRELPLEQQLQTVMDLAPRKRLAELDLDLQKFTVWMTLADKLKKIRAEYELSGTVPSMTVFHGTTPPPLPVFHGMPAAQAERTWLDRLHGWDRFTAGGAARYVKVPGEHHTLTAPPHVAVFQALLRQEIDRSMGEGGAGGEGGAVSGPEAE